MTPTIPSPASLGLPYTEWRADQYEVIQEALAAPEKVILLDAPTGRGKSGIAVGAVSIHAQRDPEVWYYDEDGPVMRRWGSLIATKTIQLQEQYLRDFPHLGLMKGRSNFGCRQGHDNAAVAPCVDGAPCDFMQGGCDYYDARFTANSNHSLAINWDYLSAAARNVHKSSPLYQRQLIIGDEAHLADDSLRSAASVTVSPFHASYLAQRIGVYTPKGIDLEDWANWAQEVIEGTEDDVRQSKKHVADPRAYKPFKWAVSSYRLSVSLSDLLSSPDHVIVKRDDRGTHFEPVLAGNAFRRLTKQFDKIILMSATLPGPDLTAKLLGLDESDYKLIRMSSTFDPNRRPLYYRPAVRVGAKMTEDDKRVLIQAMDRQISQWGDFKGIIHCHSYALAESIRKYSTQLSRFIFHGSRELPNAIEAFRRAGAGTYLVSPVAHSGVDERDVQGQIILKLPFPYLGDEVVKARKEIIPETYDQATVATLIQSYGRAMRSEDDYGETVILDANWKHWYPRVRNLFPEWVREAIR